MKRLPNWRSAFAAEAETYRRQPFEWGTRDCALFAADCIRAMTGEDLAASFRGRYATQGEAERLVFETGYWDLGGLAASLLPEIAPRFARMGDLAALTTDMGVSLGMFNGGTILVLRPDGLGTLPFRAASRAFRV